LIADRKQDVILRFPVKINTLQIEPVPEQLSAAARHKALTFQVPRHLTVQVLLCPGVESDVSDESK
jgi:hypothetical protein